MKVSFKHLSLTVALLSGVALAQVSTGTPSFGSFGGGPFDTINLGNLNVHFAIPILHKAGRGMSFSYDLSYDSSIWIPTTTSGVTQWQPVGTWGWNADTAALTGYVSFRTSVTSVPCSPVNGTRTTYTTFAYHDPLGRVHPFPGYTFEEDNNCHHPPIWWGTPVTGLSPDNSGYSINATGMGTVTITSKSGQVFSGLPQNSQSGSSMVTDANGNQLTANGTGQYFDTLSSSTPVLTVSGSGTPASPRTLTYTAPSGGNAVYAMNYTQYTVATNFGVTGISEYGRTSVALVSSVMLPDLSTYTFSYEPTPGTCTPLAGTSSCVTGRILTITLPTLGTITYAYSGGNNGIESDGSTAGLTRTLNPGGQWTYARSLSASIWTTTVTDPNLNPTTIKFAKDGNTTSPTYNFYETQRTVSQLISGTPTVLATIIKCYNATYANCSTAAVSAPITQTDIYSELPNNSTRLSEVLRNSNGLVTDDKEYDYGVAMGSAPGTTKLIRETATTYAALGNNIVNKPSSVIVQDWTSGSAVTLASTSFGYDETAATTTTGTPQHLSITGSRGNLTIVTTSTSSTTSLSTTVTYYDSGNPYVATDVNGAQTTYVYSSAANPYNSSLTASCGNSFPTTVNEPLSLSRSAQWNCIGGVMPHATDENGKVVKSDYTDSDFWRPADSFDQSGSETTISYIGQTAVETSQLFNSSHSVNDWRTTIDGFGRPILSQKLQGPGATNYDSVETDYNIVGQPDRSTMPFSAAGGVTNATAPSTNTTYDALGRALTVMDLNGGTVTNTYTNNDVLQQVSGGQTFQKQFEYDGLGRLTSVCEISGTLSGTGTCNQGTTTKPTGYWTKYAYDALGHLLKVTQNAQAAVANQQVRTYVYDWLGRMTSETNPESGTTSYSYDSHSPAVCSSYTHEPGDLMLISRANGTSVCYVHDSLHRVSDTMATGGASSYCQRFRYDASSGGLFTAPATLANVSGRLVEAETDSCAWPPTTSSRSTDEWFSYDPNGRLTDVYELTPHSGSGAYYHSKASYFSNSNLNLLNLYSSTGLALIPTQTYSVDPEGRTNLVSAASGQNPITSVTYSPGTSTAPLGALTNVTFGSADSDAFTYDPNTGRMKTYAFSVNGNTDAGTLNWNPNGTLQQLIINDQIPGTTDSGTCNYGYDDVQRVSNVTCGTFWVQNFTYDAFGNISKTVPSGDGGLSFLPSYWTSPPTNRFSALPGATPQYDSSGNLLTDNLNTYTWDGYGFMSTVSTGSATVTSTYDAFGRMVENNAGGSYTEFVYGPTGKLAKCSGQTLVKAFVALPGGAKAIYNSSGLAYYRHSDWLGSSRLTSKAPTPTSMYSSTAYAPFGEQYATSGSADPSFTGQDPDTVSNLYDFPARRHSPSQGRWISPDPSGRAAVTLTNPQTWNRYAYVTNNPLRAVDPLGLNEDFCNAENESCGGGIGEVGGNGGGWGGGGDDNSGDGGGDGSSNPGQTCDADCQLQQAEQNALLALGDPECAQAVDGGTGIASSTLSSNLAAVTGSSDPAETESFGTINTGNFYGFGGGTTTTTTAIITNPGSTVTFMSTITMSSNSNGFFMNPWIVSMRANGTGTGYSNQTFQTIEVLHELGHGSSFYGAPSAITLDGPAIGGEAGVAASLQNTVTIENACAPQGDFGGNQGPADSPPPDVPAVVKPINHHF